MRPTHPRWIVFAVTLLAAVSTGFAAVTVGEKAPDFTLSDLQGRTHRLAELKGRTVVLEWTNPECPFVRNHYESGNMPRLQKSATGEGVIWLTINSGSRGAQGDYDPEDVSEWTKKTGAAPTAYLRDQDGTLGRLYGAKTTPHMFVISPDGTLVYNGAIDSVRSARRSDLARATNYVSAALDAIKAGQPVEKATTQPYGCSVKY